MPEIQNPNLQSQGRGGGGGGDMRGTIFFMMLVFTAVLGYQYFFAKPPKSDQPAATQTHAAQNTSAQTPAAAQTAAPAAQSGNSGAEPEVHAAGHADSTPTITATTETETTVENELYRIVFTNRGALVKHWYLKKYLDSSNSGKPLDLVQQQAAERFGVPLSLFTYPDSPVSMNLLNQTALPGHGEWRAGIRLRPRACAGNHRLSLRAERHRRSKVNSLRLQLRGKRKH